MSFGQSLSYKAPHPSRTLARSRGNGTEFLEYASIDDMNDALYKDGQKPNSLLRPLHDRHKNPKKRAKSRKKSTSVRKINPAPLLYIITAKGTGKKMHFDGTKFSERTRVVTFKTADAARVKALALIAAYPVLNRYQIAVEHNQHLPSRATNPKKHAYSARLPNGPFRVIHRSNVGYVVIDDEGKERAVSYEKRIADTIADRLNRETVSPKR